MLARHEDFTTDFRMKNRRSGNDYGVDVQKEFFYGRKFTNVPLRSDAFAVFFTYVGNSDKIDFGVTCRFGRMEPAEPTRADDS